MQAETGFHLILYLNSGQDDIMLRSMREGAKSPIMKLFLLFLAAGFALWGVGDLSGGFLSGGNNAVSA